MKRHRIIRTRRQRIAWTNTSQIPDKKIVEAIKFVAAEVDLDRVVVHFKRCGYRRTYGRAYGYIPSIANLDGLKPHEWRYLIVVTDDGDWVDTLGHEAKHVEQFRRGTLRRERKTRNCEAQARAFGGWISQRWIEAQP